MPNKNTIEFSKIFIWNGLAYQKLACADILWIEKHQGKTRIISTKHHFLLSVSLKKLNAQIPCAMLQQIHRSYIVNLNQIDGFEQRKVFIRQKAIPIGTTYWQTFREQYVFDNQIVYISKNK